MSDNLSKITKILLIVLFVVAILFTIKFYMGLSSIEGMKAEEFNIIETTDMSILDEGTDSLLEAKKGAINWLGYFFKYTYFVGFLAAGAVTETILLGAVALRAGKKIMYDAENMKITNIPAANKYLYREYRKGWEL